ncbi:hypothetical protein ACFX1X_024529 [Malus domestica]
MTLITATLSTAALSCVISCQSSQEMWNNLRERFSNMTRTSIVQMKIDMQNIKKGSESIDLYLQQIKNCRDQLAVVGVFISDEDIVIVALKGLPNEFNTIKAVIRGRENLVSLKELRSQLKAEEATLDEVIKQAPIMSAMYASNSVYDAGGSSGGAAHNVSQHFFNGSHFPISSTPVFQQMPFPNQMFQMNSPLACVSQGGSGTYNNFRGNNFKPKGKGKKFYNNFQQPQQTGASFPQQSSSNNFIRALLFSLSILLCLLSKCINRCRFVKYVIGKVIVLFIVFKKGVKFAIGKGILLPLVLIEIVVFIRWCLPSFLHHHKGSLHSNFNPLNRLLFLHHFHLPIWFILLSFILQ